MAISETVSEKPKRGRPRSRARVFLDLLGAPPLDALGMSDRTQVSRVYQDATTQYVENLLEADDRRLFLGGTQWHVTSRPPRGYATFAVEFGRWAEGADAGTICQQLVDVVQCVREGRATFTQIAAHFRQDRLGKRAGKPISLARHITRALREYLARFPETTPQDVRAAVGWLAHITRDEQEAAP